MSDTLFSPHWYRVAPLRPRLPAHARINRHEYRGETWYVLQDSSSGRHYRFNAPARQVIELMDGSRSVEDAWKRVNAELGDDAPTQAELIELLGALHAADLLLCDVPPDTAALFRRQQREARRRWRSRWNNPLALRLPLVNPDRFLERCLPWARPCFSRAAGWLWLVALALAAMLAAKHWDGIAAHAADRALAPANLLLLWMIYPVVKLVHELGHAFATKVWGGGVPEMGVMFLVLIPMPYVDASAASAFPESRRRMAVSAAGIVVELFLAAFALFAWTLLQPGLLRDAALDVMLIGGLSTVLFNGNPLLRFDGYYVLADAIGIPGLATRSAQYYGYLVQRHVFALAEARSPVSASGERAWFIAYGLSSYLYRLGITVIIVLYLGGKYLIAGVALALWAVATQILYPLVKAARFVLNSPALHAHRARAVLASLAAVLALTLALVGVPLPLSTHADGVVWLPEQAQVRAGAEGFVEELLVPDGSHVQPGEALVRVTDPDLESRIQVLESEQREFQTRYFAMRGQDLVQAEVIRQDLRAAEATLARAREHESEQVLRAGVAGTFVVPQASHLPGRFVKQGEVVGYVVDADAITVRVVIPQSDIGQFRRVTRAVRLRSADVPGEIVTARILREAPEAVERLPSRALGTLGGGRIGVDPLDTDGVRTRARIFQIDLALPPEAARAAHLGARVYARFDHGYEPLAFRWTRAVKRQLLRQFAE
ncbi:MAG: hypothetical protein A3E57_00085 [Candidatus Muproteobacteria bacterium RIFCSPHIGHO2_12_FULL_60_33]|nr:MAG: hypothetical protein A3E57_00085 [Candidatus Muproteobacteria bacterium RIFCSPHIGHO2_12_FULL_60_33]OGI57867.1 MAG: hypothetical protein A2809_07115 [Candidatus Muproteobacteria bacterium RIFCSPHIGHO2_01_FULL_61_200]